ncbi:hypothetical protein PIB30_093411 [Stylosanthes scabra]|uniref:Uncharacterized protein n=1 Tax=Stylosanthes scabra TaxID=79078 RepID=A0ABU6QVM5_9FABA|nr:hypothetical protein [Stylosanthes scabra]
MEAENEERKSRVALLSTWTNEDGFIRRDFLHCIKDILCRPIRFDNMMLYTRRRIRSPLCFQLFPPPGIPWSFHTRKTWARQATFTLGASFPSAQLPRFSGHYGRTWIDHDENGLLLNGLERRVTVQFPGLSCSVKNSSLNLLNLYMLRKRG